MLTRIITGAVGITMAAFIIQTGGMIFGVSVLLLMCIGWHEYAKAFAVFGKPLSYYSGMTIMVLLWGAAYKHLSALFVFVALAGVLWVMIQSVIKHDTFSVEQSCASATGIIYVGFTFVHLMLLRFWGQGNTIETQFGTIEEGCSWIWVALIGTWASDTFAYFTGCSFGKRKLCEAISPKKTIEGFLGGVVGTVLSVAAVGYFFSLPLIPMAFLGFIIAIVATMGDLVESAVKRYTGIKDSGNIIPGHGGVLDRFDSVMFSVPFVYYVVRLLDYFNILTR